jgi:uncharacterized protein (TIRG00374 family)
VNKAAGIIAALLVTCATLSYALWDVDFGQLWEVLRNGNSWIFLPFLALLSIFFLLNALRWSLMLRPFGRFSVGQVTPSMMIGFAGNNVLPLRLGELIRTVIFARELRQSRTGVLMTLVLERALDVLGILLVYVAGLSLIDSVPPAFRMSALVAAPGFVVLASFLLLFLRFPRRARQIWGTVSRSLSSRIAERGIIYIGHLEQGLQSLKSPALATALVAISLLRWMLAAAMAWLCVLSYGPAVSLGLAMVVVGVAALAVSLPSAPGFIGPIQAAFVLALTPFGVSQEVAFAASAMFLLGHWVPVTAVGGFFFLSRHYSYTRIRSECETLESGGRL